MEWGVRLAYIVNQFFDFGSVRVFALRRGGARDGQVNLLLCGSPDVVEQVREVRGGLQIDFAVVGVHRGYLDVVQGRGAASKCDQRQSMVCA